MQEIQIPNGYFQLWQMYLIERGLNGLQLDFMHNQREQLEHILSLPIDTQSSYTFFLEVVQRTQQHLDCPQLIFDMARYIRPEHFGLLGYMASRSHSVAEAIHYVMRFSRLVIDGSAATTLQVYQSGDEIHLSWPCIHEKYALIHEMTFACIVALARQIFNFNQPLLKSIHFAHAAQNSIYHYQKFYNAEVLFKQSEYQLVLSLESLKLPSQQADPSLIHLLTKQAEEAIAAKPNEISLAQYIHTWVADYLRTENKIPKIEQIAAELYLSTRTLQRQLDQLETSFKKIIEIERMKRCEQLLLQNMSLTDLAMHLGYSDQSALTRAYKAHTGHTLLQRKQQIKIFRQVRNDK